MSIYAGPNSFSVWEHRLGGASERKNETTRLAMTVQMERKSIELEGSELSHEKKVRKYRGHIADSSNNNTVIFTGTTIHCSIVLTFHFHLN